MGYNTNSDYAINKKTNDIVYEFGNGDTTRLELEDGVVYMHFTSTKNPQDNYSTIDKTMTAEEFVQLKATSDADYYETDRKDIYESKETVSINGLEDTTKVSVPSCEDELIEKLTKSPRKKADPRNIKNAMKILDKVLTPTQKRRYIANVQHGQSSHSIAEYEGVAQRSVYESIETAKKKIENYLKSNSKKSKNTLSKRAKKVV